jgi:comEA protein
MSDKLDRYWPVVVLLLFTVLVISGIVLFIKQTAAQTTEITIHQTPTIPITGEVCISGAVGNPGYFPIKSTETLGNLIHAANPTADANLNTIKVYIESTNDTPSPQKISLNRADAWLLALLPGIGQGKAQAIITYRTKNGHFNHIDDVLKVEGIGNGTFDKIKTYITVED